MKPQRAELRPFIVTHEQPSSSIPPGIRMSASTYFDRALFPLTILFAFLIPLRLSLALVPFVPLVVLAVLTLRERLATTTPATRSITAPLLFLVIVSALSSILGVAPERSVRPALSLLSYSLALPIVAECISKFGAHYIVAALFLGQAIASLHTVLDAAMVGAIPRMFNGAITESGQLAIVGTMAAYLTMHGISKAAIPLRHAMVGTCATLAFSSLGFLGLNGTPLSVAILAGILAAGLYGAVNFQRIRGSLVRLDTSQLSLIAAPLLVAALAINLKRGPWLGCILSLSLVFAWKRPRLLLPFLALCGAALVAFAPVRERITDSYSHFLIGGGRAEMWELGFDIAGLFPLGVGMDNARAMRLYDREILPEHTHLHNNVLNLWFESGLLAVGIYVFWIFRSLRLGLLSQNPLGTAAALGVLASQVAGLVEFNAGDSEVFLVQLIALGIVAGTITKKPE